MSNDYFTVLVSGGGESLSEYMYCEAIVFKMNEPVEQQICIQFCVKLEHSSVETIWMIQRASALGNW